MTSQLWDSHRAEGYDEGTAHLATEPAVDFLADLALAGPAPAGPAASDGPALAGPSASDGRASDGRAPGGRALELAIGTGRIALPLSRRGVTVAGIDTSEAMLAHLRAKPGADQIQHVVGDMSADRVPGAEFDLVYLVFNTITNLLTQSAQVACFRNAARHLRPGGSFVIECYVPDLRLLPIGALAVPFTLEDDYVGVDTYDLLTQRQTSHHFRAVDGSSRVIRSEHRYAWPSEMDLMAELAGLTPTDRWADWSRAPFTADSRSHVSVWQKPAVDRP
jgi:SAM-dependent methyltransferase